MAFGKSHRNPFVISVGHLIEKATFAGVQTEDCGQFVHICDMIITSKDGPKEAVRASKKKISKHCNHKEIQLTLSIWSRGFPRGVDVSEVKEIYLELLKKGVQFPSWETEIGTERQVALSLSITKPSPFVLSTSVHSSAAASKAPTISLVAEQKLYKTGQDMQERIMDLLAVVENEDVTVELIQVNEDLNQALLGYERFFLKSETIPGTKTEPRESPEEVSSSHSTDANPLNPLVHSQLDLLALENPEISLSPQRADQSISVGHMYDNFLTHLNPILMQPVNLQGDHAGPSSHRPPASSSNQPAGNDHQPPHYYEVIEFDPLTPGATTDNEMKEEEPRWRSRTIHIC